MSIFRSKKKHDDRMTRMTKTTKTTTMVTSSISILVIGFIATIMAFGSVTVSAFVPCGTNKLIFSKKALITRTSTATEKIGQVVASTTVSFSLFSEQADDNNGGGDSGDEDLLANIDDELEAWDVNVDYDKEWPGGNPVSSKSSATASTTTTPEQFSWVPDPATAWDDLPAMPDDEPKLGIDIDLDPLSLEEAKKLRNDAREIVEKNVNQGVQEIEKLREKMTKDIEKSKRAMELASEWEAKKKSTELITKIDKLTNQFLDSTEETRSSTKLAATASKNMEGTGTGIDMGTWGTIGGRSVITDGNVPSSTASAPASLLGSVQNAQQQKTSGGKKTDAVAESDTTTTTTDKGNRILIIADTKQDPYAKELVPALIKQLEAMTDLTGTPATATNGGNDSGLLQIDTLQPTSTIPLGGNDADCLIVFCTSLSSSTTLKSILDRTLRKTLQAGTGQLGSPPTQIIAISSVGTERVDKFPYSMTNLMNGGKLEQRRQMEELIINTVQRRVVEPALDYTIIKLGGDGKKQSPSSTASTSTSTFHLQPGDTLDDPTNDETAAATIIQAMAYQPFARNATMCISGSLPSFALNYNNNDVNAAKAGETYYEFWDSTFLCLEGPEVWRKENILFRRDEEDETMYGRLVEYIREWAIVLAENGEGLTTPVRAEIGYTSMSAQLVQRQDVIRLVFLPTKTGKFYMSKQEERQRDAERSNKNSNSNKVPNFSTIPSKRFKEGGIDVVIELTQQENGMEPTLRVRARRCNYGDDTIIKELSEKTIIKRLQEAIDVWEQQEQ